jgi:DNA repair protein RadC
MKTKDRALRKERDLRKHLEYMIPQIRLVMLREPETKAKPITMPADVERFLEPLKYNDVEQFVALHLDAKSNVIGYQIVSQGTLTSSLVHPREVFKAAILSNSNSLIVAHNHPAGSLDPSDDDRSTTRQLIEAGQLLQIPVVDHIIVSVKGIRSVREYYPYLWS